MADRRRAEALRNLSEHGIARHDRGVRIRQRDRRADFERLAAFAYALQLLHISDVEESRQITQLLGYPEPDVRPAREQQGARLALVEAGKLVERARRPVAGRRIETHPRIAPE